MKEDIAKFIPILFFVLFFLGPLLGRGVFFILMILLIFFIIKKVIPSTRGKMRMSKTIDLNSFEAIKKIKKNLIVVVLLFFGVWLFFASIVIIDAGWTGVYSLFGKVKSEELKSGFHLVIPLAQVTKMTIRTEEYTMSVAQGEGKKYEADAISSLTKEGLSVDLDMTVLYRLEEEKASDVYSEVGLDYEEKILRPTIRTSIRDIIAQYEAKDIYSEKREEAAQKIKDSLVSAMESRGIIIEEVLLRNVELPDRLTQAIQEKLQAEQEAQKYEFLLDREEKEKERKIIEAEGQRDAQQIINQSLTTNYLYYLYISELKDREGTIYIPTSPTTGMPLYRNVGQ